MERTGPDDITKELTIRTLRPGGLLECTTILPVDEDAIAAGLTRLCSASGTDLGMVLLMARKHCPDFVERVAAYRVTGTPDGVEIPCLPGQTPTTIEFFERKA